MSHLAKDFGIEEPEGWYNISVEDVRSKSKGIIVLQRYSGSLLALLRVSGELVSFISFIFPYLNLSLSFRMLCGTLRASRLATVTAGATGAR
jgi:hypothetical protein